MERHSHNVEDFLIRLLIDEDFVVNTACQAVELCLRGAEGSVHLLVVRLHDDLDTAERGGHVVELVRRILSCLDENILHVVRLGVELTRGDEQDHARATATISE